MHQSTLLRRVSSLVIGALAASMFIAMIAFFMAGRRTTMDMEINSALDQNRVYYQLFELKKDFFDNPDYSDKFFQSTSKSKQDFYLLDGNDRIIGHTPESALSVTKEETEEALQYFRDSDKTTFGKN